MGHTLSMVNKMNHGDHIGQCFTPLDDGRIRCDVCPRQCQLKDGQRGFCFVRQHKNQQMVLTTYGRSSGFCIDPIEKKPLNHFYPGTSVLSFGTAGCNLGCRFCQNWDMSKAREMDRLMDHASPEKIARVAQQLGCKSVAFTYNDPVIFMEYAIDIAKACRALGIQTVAVSAGYMMPDARQLFYAHIDAANIDLKAFTQTFYKTLCFAELGPVLDTLVYLKHETEVWFEVTTLLIPGQNDGDDEIQQLSQWMMDQLGPDVPLHFTAFHPDFKMMDTPQTPIDTLTKARDIALAAGLHYVYTGNVHDADGSSTYCPNCLAMVIERDWYELGNYDVLSNGCARCGHPMSGILPDAKGTWGRQRMPVQLSDMPDV